MCVLEMSWLCLIDVQVNRCSSTWHLNSCRVRAKSEAIKPRSICCNLLQVSWIFYCQTRLLFGLNYMFIEMYNKWAWIVVRTNVKGKPSSVLKMRYLRLSKWLTASDSERAASKRLKTVRIRNTARYAINPHTKTRHAGGRGKKYDRCVA